MRIGRCWQAAEKCRQHIGQAIGNNTALQLLIRGFPVQPSHRGGGQIADRLDRVDGEQQCKRDAGRKLKLDAEMHESGKGEPRRVSHFREIHHAKHSGDNIPGDHAQQNGGKLADALALVGHDHHNDQSERRHRPVLP